jgi:hypothetical protein
MRYCFLSLIAATLVLATGCERAKAEKKGSTQHQANATSAAGAADPANGEPLLLLDEGPATRPGADLMADNSRCHVCHLNYAMEDIALQHAKVSIGCPKCHGDSDAHIADESWGSGLNGTAPDKMYTLNRVNPMCLECHPRDKIDPDLHKTWLAGVSEQKYCTDCHGKHRLPNRKCKWK